MEQITQSTAAVSWTDANREHLRAELNRLRLLFRRKVRWLRLQWQQDPVAASRAIVISDMFADRILTGCDEAEEIRFYQEDSESRAITNACNEMEISLSARRQSLTEAGGIPASEALVRLFGLSTFERDVLLLTFAAADDPGFTALCAYLQDDAHARFATEHLIRSVLCLGQEDREAARGAFVPSAPLRRFRLIAAGDASTTAALSIDPRVADYIRGINRLDESLVPMLRPIPRIPLARAHLDLVDELVLWAKSAGGEPWPPFFFTGPPDAGGECIAVEFCARAGMQIYSLDPRRLPTNDTDRQHLVQIVERETILSRIALYLDVTDLDPGDKPLTAAVRDWIERAAGVLVIGGRERWDFQRQVLHLKILKPDHQAQRSLWNKCLEAVPNSVDGQLDAIIQQFDLGPQLIPQAVHSAAARARSRPGNATLHAEDLWRACREQVGWQLGGLAQRLQPCYTWDDIVLPADLIRQLWEIAGQVAARPQVYEAWGFGARLPRGRGISALFSGPSGTGKTMAAEILANHLQLDLYRIDLAGVVSKYIGETEKNLRNVFDAAEQSGAILFFDEADALFGKRSEVKDSHDRYANIEINYLLQRMEDYRGLAVLCTNRRSALDRAFLRRLRFLVEFPFPDCDHRRLIWQKVFPAQAPLDSLDLDALARLEISGGNIRNIALNAAFLAAGQKSTIGMRDVLHAARREYAKIDKMLTEAEFGSHYRLMKS